MSVTYLLTENIYVIVEADERQTARFENSIPMSHCEAFKQMKEEATTEREEHDRGTREVSQPGHSSASQGGGIRDTRSRAKRERHPREGSRIPNSGGSMRPSECAPTEPPAARSQAAPPGRADILLPVQSGPSLSDRTAGSVPPQDSQKQRQLTQKRTETNPMDEPKQTKKAARAKADIDPDQDLQRDKGCKLEHVVWLKRSP